MVKVKNKKNILNSSSNDLPLVKKLKSQKEEKARENNVVKFTLPSFQPGRQSQFGETTADIAIFGGAAGGGKTFALLRKFLEHIENPDYGAVIFRRTSPEITTEGGLWDESKKLFSIIPGAIPREGKLDWKFPSGASISFGHAQHEKDVENKFPGAQIAYIGFDELNKFTEKQFWFLFSRNRTTCGIKPRIDATCNPDADSWVAKLIDWWIDPSTGYPIPERAGVLRYFYRLNNVIYWGDTPEELMEKFPELAKIAPPKSLTFIPATLDDNQILLEQNPEYKANLLSLLNVDMERLLKGNWKIKWSAGLVFNRSWFEIINEEDLPKDLTGAQFVRFWDLASTAKEVASNSSCFSASQKWMKIKINGEYVYFILDCYWEQLGAEEGDNQIITMAMADGKKIKQRWELEGGSASRRHEQTLIKAIKKSCPEADCKGVQPLGDKLTRAKPWAMSARSGQIKIVRAWWNEQFLSSVDAFDGSKKTPPTNDIVDAGSGAYSCLYQNLTFGGGLGTVR
jgi:predicted phage terminase large subunit-like protein